MAIRSHSAPLGGPDGAGADGAGADVNPFYSEWLQGELRLQALRPRELPGDGALPAGDAGCLRLAGEANGKGRGDGTVMFTTPSSWEEAGRPVTYGPPGRNQQNGSQSQREMPREPVMGPGPQTMGAVKQPDQQECSGADELQRALEGELVDFLRQQNSQLMKEIADFKAAAATSPWSTVRGGSVGDGPGSSERTAKRWMSRSPRPSRRREHVSPGRNGTSGDARDGDQLQFTPNGARIPAGPPPSEDGNVTPVPPPVPPLPMMPTELTMPM